MDLLCVQPCQWFPFFCPDAWISSQEGKSQRLTFRIPRYCPKVTEEYDSAMILLLSDVTGSFWNSARLSPYLWSWRLYGIALAPKTFFPSISFISASPQAPFGVSVLYFFYFILFFSTCSSNAVPLRTACKPPIFSLMIFMCFSSTLSPSFLLFSHLDCFLSEFTYDF